MKLLTMNATGEGDQFLVEFEDLWDDGLYFVIMNNEIAEMHFDNFLYLFRHTLLYLAAG